MAASDILFRDALCPKATGLLGQRKDLAQEFTGMFGLESGALMPFDL